MAETDEQMLARLRSKASGVELESILAYDEAGQLCREKGTTWTRAVLKFVDGATFEVPRRLERHLRHVTFRKAKPTKAAK